MRLGIALLLAAVAAGVLAVTALSRSDGKARLLLPDIDLLAPSSIQIGVARGKDGKRRWLLAFTASAHNVGEGALEIVGRRPNTKTKRMRATQQIYREDGSIAKNTGAGRLAYVVDPTHQHWHVTPFMEYELKRIRTAPGQRLRRVIRRDEKTGFCLGDRQEFDDDARGGAKPASRVYAHNCGFNKPWMLWMKEGISPGWVDDYQPFRDGQQIDISTIPAGRYRLVQRVNAEGLLRERTLRNNFSSAVMDISWPNGRKARPRLVVLNTCQASPSCKA